MLTTKVGQQKGLWPQTYLVLKFHIQRNSPGIFEYNKSNVNYKFQGAKALWTKKTREVACRSSTTQPKINPTLSRVCWRVTEVSHMV